jgi:hypothetical protein
MLASSTSASEYLALVSECRTQNKLNKLHIGLENILAPSEFGYLADLARSQQLPGRSYPWLVRMAALSPGIFESPQGFRRRALSQNVLVYEDPSRHDADKSLLVAFGGNCGRLGMPASVFLQCIDSRAWDVVLLRKGAPAQSYLAGLEGVSRHVPGVIRYVKTATSAQRYRRVMTIGTSSGGYAAILAAILMNAYRGASICGHPPQAPLGLRLRWHLRRASAKCAAKLIFAYGADFSRDHEAARSLQSSFGGRLHPIEGVDCHNALTSLLKHGQLAQFLDEMLAE